MNKFSLKTIITITLTKNNTQITNGGNNIGHILKKSHGENENEGEKYEQQKENDGEGKNSGKIKRTSYELKIKPLNDRVLELQQELMDQEQLLNNKINQNDELIQNMEL